MIRSKFNFIPHLVLLLGVLIFTFPIYLTFIGSTWDAPTIARGHMPLVPGPHLVENYQQALTSGEGQRIRSTPATNLLRNTFIVAIVITVGKIIISLLSAYAVVFFEFPGRMMLFWAIFITIMLPVEVRIMPTYKVVSDLGMINTFAGLTLPLIASATATLLFRQFFMTVPDELVDAARMDGAGPMRFFWSILLPLSRTNIAALFVIMFIFGWNQYLWPLLITTSRSMETIVIGIVKMIGSAEASTDWNLIMSTTMLALIPPVLIVIIIQRWFVKGLVDSDK
jgi:sn-glycerol 3-phosphate transport system permease protein